MALFPLRPQPPIGGYIAVGNLPAGAVSRQEDQDLPHSLDARPPLPFTPPTEVDPAEKEEPKKDDKKETPKVPAVTIDLEGIAARLIPAPVPLGNYRSLAVTEKALFWLSSQAGKTKNAALQTIPINHDDPEIKSVAEKVTGFELSADRKKLLLLRDKELLLVDAASGKLDEKKAKVDLAHWTFAVDPREEWRQMFVEAWRRRRCRRFPGRLPRNNPLPATAPGEIVSPSEELPGGPTNRWGSPPAGPATNPVG
jgi:hypothetical protein